ncbi:MAG TPA: methyltransferase domain-containing protein [Candidatus Binatia bacterium]|nr:methyltransferase domain-containing protein [Candidatus Binatia bacterium]
MTESKDPPITAGTIEPRATAVYALGSNPAESARLRRQSDELRPYSAELLDRVGLQPGQTAIDLGCGPCGILQLLSERVSPGGRVVGVDADPTHVTMATQFADEQGLRNVEIKEADAGQTGLPSRSFDLVHSRTLLVTIPEPATVVAEMVRLARPGGWVASLEPDTEHGLCYPAHPAFARLGALFGAAFRRNGADPFIGRRLPELYRNAGLHDIGVEARAPIHPPGDTRRTIQLDLVRSMRPMILAMGLAEERELDELDRTAREHLANPNTLVMPGLYFLAWGRTPDFAA